MSVADPSTARDDAPPLTQVRVQDAALATDSGADGVRVETEEGLHEALRLALAAEGPFVVDVLTDNSENAPWMRRIQALISQKSEQTAPAGGVQ